MKDKDEEVSAWKAWQFECPYCESICEVDGNAHSGAIRNETCINCGKKLIIKCN